MHTYVIVTSKIPQLHVTTLKLSQCQAWLGKRSLDVLIGALPAPSVQEYIWTHKLSGCMYQNDWHIFLWLCYFKKLQNAGLDIKRWSDTFLRCWTIFGCKTVDDYSV